MRCARLRKALDMQSASVLKTRISMAALCLFTALLLAPAGCSRSKEILISGATMGTTYHIKVITGRFYRPAILGERITERLAQINRSMSTYMAQSEISRFNALAKPSAKMQVSDDFWNVLKVARRIYDLTGGAWDGTVYPLVMLWGFGSSKPITRIPQPEQIQRILPHIGFRHILLLPYNQIEKSDPALKLDLASIAKGYGVDQIALLLKQEHFQNFLVEIGGEVVASGLRHDGKTWRVGINRPQADAAFDAVYQTISLHDMALATSGDYRNFFEFAEKHYSHVIDPHSGQPVSNHVVSVSVAAPSCTLADGLATGIMVMGAQNGLRLVDRLNGVECLIIVKGPDSRLMRYTSRGFKQLESGAPGTTKAG